MNGNPNEKPAAGSAGGSSVTWDPQIAATLRDLASPDEPDFVGELVETFLADARQSLAIVHDALLRGDAAAALRAAHRVRGAALNLGARRLAEAAGALEREAKSGASATLGPLADALDAELARFAARAAVRSAEPPAPAVG